MALRRNVWSRLAVAAATLIAAVGAASPAAAATTTADLEVTAPDVTMAAESAGKPAHLTMTNHGPADVHVATLVVDTRDLDTSKVQVSLLFCDEPQPAVYECSTAGLETDVVPSGLALDWPIMINRLRDGAGDAGSITFSAKHDGTDPNPDNNQVRVGVTIGDHGADLVASAGDVRNAGRILSNGDTDVTGPLHPGQNGLFGYLVRNVGDRPADGVKLTAKLPEHVTFTQVSDGCVIAPDRGAMTCTYPDLILLPADQDETGDSVLFAVNLVTVAAGTRAPATFTGGLITVEALAAGPAEAESSGRAGSRGATETASPGRADAGSLGAAGTEASDRADARSTGPAGAESPGSADAQASPSAVAGASTATESAQPQGVEAAAPEIDPGDNRDGFNVAVFAAPPGSGGGGSGGGGGGAGGGGGETLPITGVQAGLIGGIGAAVVLAGVLLMLAGRRRRFVPVAPTDEKPES